MKMGFLVQGSKAGVLAILLLAPVAAWAGHPLVTDDTGTQGRGKYQFEVNGAAEHDTETQDGVEVKGIGVLGVAALTAGVRENIDLVASLPYQWYEVKVDGVRVVDEKGVADVALEAKWRFYENEGASLALKPGLSLPTGDSDTGLGTGRFGYQLLAIASLDRAPWAFHANLGYVRNENKVGEEQNLYHLSAAVTYEVVKNLRLAADLGREKNLDPNGVNDPSYLLGGLIYGLNENLDLDCGLKYCLNAAETDLSLLAGVTMRW